MCDSQGASVLFKDNQSTRVTQGLSRTITWSKRVSNKIHAMGMNNVGVHNVVYDTTVYDWYRKVNKLNNMR